MAVGVKKKNVASRLTQRSVEDYVVQNSKELANGSLKLKDAVDILSRRFGVEVTDYVVRKACRVMGVAVARSNARFFGMGNNAVIQGKRTQARSRVITKAIGIVAGQLRQVMRELNVPPAADFDRLTSAASVMAWVEHEVAREFPMPDNNGKLQ